MRAFVICLLFLIGVINAGPRESIIKKTQTLISSFFSESQLEKIFDLKEKYEYAGKNVSKSSKFNFITLIIFRNEHRNDGVDES
jgi:hypothetical protein